MWKAIYPYAYTYKKEMNTEGLIEIIVAIVGIGVLFVIRIW